jgi:hypothetical protein
MENKADKSIEFAKENLALIKDYVGKDPVYIVAAGNSGKTYQAIVYDILAHESYDVAPGLLTYEYDEVKGFEEVHMKGRKIIVITKNSIDEGTLYKKLIAKKYSELKDKCQPLDFVFITVEPFSMEKFEEILFKN